MLHTGYKFTRDRPFASANKIKGQPAQWTLGVVIKELGQPGARCTRETDPKEAAQKLVDQTVSGYLSVGSAVVVFLMLGLVGLYYKSTTTTLAPASVVERRRASVVVARARSLSQTSLLPR